MDSIAKANYTLWTPAYSMPAIVAAANAQIASSTNFNGITDIINSLEKYRDEEVPLNINEYRKMQAKMKVASKKLKGYLTIADNLKVSSLPVDLSPIGSDTLKMNKQNLFVKAVSSNIYIDETVKVMDK